MKALEKRGEYRRIHDKWFGIYQVTSPSLKDALRYSAIVIIPLLFIILLAVIWTWSLRRQVAEKTHALKESLDRFKYVFEASNVGKSFTLLTGEITVNNAFADFLGYTQEELKGKKWQDLTPVEDIKKIEKRIGLLLTEEKRSDRFEKRYVHKNGTTLWADVSVTIRRDARENPLYFMTTVVDITARKQAEEALRNSEEFQRAMIDCSPVALFTIDLDGNVLTWNASAEKIFGWHAEETIGKPLPIVPADKQEESDALLWQIFKGGGFIGKELIRLRNDGTLFPVSLSAAPVHNDRNQVVGILGAVEDLTERKKIEAEREQLQSQLLQAQKMESVGRLAGGVAHDYNNMLSVIIGYAQFGMDKTDPEDELRADLQEILTAAERSADITRQLLAFARKQTINPKALDLNETVESMFKMIRRLIGEDIDLSWKPGPAVWPVKMDPSQLDQILVNLCINARDAISDVGRITIETHNVRFDEAYCANHAGFVPGEYVLLAVSDDGRGMDKETLDKIFEPFYTTKEIGKGTGLGLSVIYGIIKQNKGFINVYSEPEKGTTFQLYFSRHADDASPIETVGVGPEKTPVGSGETVMIVEDEASILKLAKRILIPLTYNVLTATSPNEALVLAKEHGGDIHLLIADVVLPGMNGRDLAEKLQAEYPKLKVLFMSGYTSDVIVHHGVLDADVQFIQKPFSKTNFAIKVRKALNNE